MFEKLLQCDSFADVRCLGTEDRCVFVFPFIELG